jgi:pyruvate formate lyase activating enzyme
MSDMKKGLIFDIKRFAIHDGPGIRTTVFFKGCPARCWWCHNPEAVYPAQDDKTGKSLERMMTADELMIELKKDRIFYEQSGGGVTFSGGEPLAQPEFLNEVLEKCKQDENYFHTALDTTGYASWKTLEIIAEKTDLFLYDLKLMDSAEHRKYTGIPNELILDNLKMLADKGKDIIIRFPVIPGITDQQNNINKIKEYVASLKNVREIDILAYHKMGESKYEKLGLEYKCKGVVPPSSERMQEIKKGFEDSGFIVKIGG